MATDYPTDPWAKKMRQAFEGERTFDTGGAESQRAQLEALSEGFGDDREENRRIMAENYEGDMPLQTGETQEPAFSKADFQAYSEGRFDAISPAGHSYLAQLGPEGRAQLDSFAKQPAPEAEPSQEEAKSYEARMQEYIKTLSPGDRFLIGAGKTFNDMWMGLQQLVADDPENEQLKAEIKAENDAFDILDKEQVGWEDVGEIAGDAAVMALGGSAAGTIKGGAILTGLIEGVKGVEEGESRASNATGGAIAGATGGVVGKVAGAGGRNFTHSILNPREQVLKANGLVDVVVGGLGRIFSRGEGNARLVRGTANLLKKANAYQRASSRRVVSGPALQTVRDARKEALTSARQAELEKLSNKAFDSAADIIQRMSSRGKGQVVLDEMGNTLESIVKTNTEIGPNGLPGIKIGEFVKEMSLFSNKQLKEALGETYSNNIRYLVQHLKERSAEVVDPAQISQDVASYVDKLVRDGVDLSKVPPAERKRLVEWALKASQTGIRTQSNLRGAAGTAAGVDAFDAIEGQTQQYLGQQ